MILMKEGVGRINVMSIFLLSMTQAIINETKGSMTSYLLVEDYGISKHDSGSYSAKLGWWTDIAIIPGDLLLGMLLDIFGRKKLIIGGLIMCGIIMYAET